MDCEQQRYPQCAGNTESSEDHAYQQRVEPVEQDVDQVVTRGIEAPQVVLDPETAEDQRVVLRGLCCEPDVAQTLARSKQGVVRDVGIVVPDETGVEDGCVGCEGREQDEARPEDEAGPALAIDALGARHGSAYQGR